MKYLDSCLVTSEVPAEYLTAAKGLLLLRAAKDAESCASTCMGSSSFHREIPEMGVHTQGSLLALQK